MRRLEQSSIRNNLLRLLSEVDLDLLQADLEAVDLPVGRVLVTPNKPIEHVYFPESGIASAVAIRRDGHRIEVGIYGSEGMSGFPLLLGSDQTPIDHFMQVAGYGHRVETAAFLAAVERSRTLHTLLVRYVHVFTTQTSQTALANGTSRVEERLARWLLMCHDRIDGNEILLTHKFLSVMLRVRRAGVTDVIHVLEGRGLVRASRGKIVIRDREGLKELAAASYGLPESEYKRLIK